MIDTGADTGKDPKDENGYFHYDTAPEGEAPPFAASPGLEGPGFDRPAFEGAPFETAPFEKPSQLDLGEEDTRLPWLEGDDEFEEERSGMGQGVLLAGLGLLAIGLVVAAVLWITRHKPEQELVADGGVISAPKEPYKVRPENPGGEVVAGTGDTSFAVAEGQRRPPSIGGSEAAEPGFTAAKPEAKPSSTASAPAAKATPAPAAEVKGVGVQVGAYASKEAAETGWNTLKGQYSALGVVHHRVVQGQADIGTVYRLQAVPGDAAAARSLCSGMKSAGLSCQVKN